MAIIYATLIIKDKKTFTEVPDRIKDKVKEVLVDLDCGELAEQKNRLGDRQKSPGYFLIIQHISEGQKRGIQTRINDTVRIQKVNKYAK